MNSAHKTRTVVLCPAAHPDAQANFSKTIEQGVAISSLPRVLAEDLPDHSQRGEGDLLRAWGTTQTHWSHWTRIQRGDLLLFVKYKMIFAITSCLACANSKELSNFLWNTPDRGLIVFVEPPRKVEIPFSELNHELGYSPKFKVQRFQALDETRSSIAVRFLHRYKVQ